MARDGLHPALIVASATVTARFRLQSGRASIKRLSADAQTIDVGNR